MAERRMFAKSVINSARFLRMPSTARLLYYDLGMAADDDGIVESFTVMRTTGAAEDDLRVLAAKGFISVLNDDLVAYIMDWKQNNHIRPDRYKPSMYSSLLVKINDGIPNDNQVDTDGIPLVDERYPQDRLGKDRLGKDRIEEGAGRTPAPKRKRFSPPTVEEVQEYINAQGYSMSAQAFVDFYTSNGWKVGKNSMKDWKAAVRGWQSREKKPAQHKPVIEARVDYSNLYT